MNPPGDITVLTIGHSNHPIARFVSLLRTHRVTAIADVRSSPYSRPNPQFNRALLQQSLKAQGIAYVFLGRELGGRPEDPSCYVDGKVQYRRLAETPLFKKGLGRIRKGARSHRIALLCAEAEPLVCHRTILVAQELALTGLRVSHVHPDNSLESHAEAMSRLVGLLGLADKDLYRSEEEIVADACALQAKRIAYESDDIREKASA
jgi:uncharacterized protein (DUF488 family)